MNIFGMGAFEILVVLLVAFIVLGPKRMADTARLLGKATREIRRVADGLPGMGLDEEVQKLWERPVAHRRDGESRSGPEAQGGTSEAPESKGRDSGDDSPVAFQSSGSQGGPEAPDDRNDREKS